MASSKCPIAFFSQRFSIILDSRNRRIFHFTVADPTYFFFFFLHLPRSDYPVLFFIVFRVSCAGRQKKKKEGEIVTTEQTRIVTTTRRKMNYSCSINHVARYTYFGWLHIR